MKKPSSPSIVFLLLMFLIYSKAKSQSADFHYNRTFGAPFQSPIDIAVDEGNFLFILDIGKVKKVDLQGKLISSVTLDYGKNEILYSSFLRDKEGKIYALNATEGKVHIFNEKGESIKQFGSSGAGDGQLNAPLGFTRDEAGSFYIADTDNERIQKFNSDGSFNTTFKLPPTDYHGIKPAYNRPVSVKVTKGGIIYVLTIGYRVFKISPSGELLQTFDPFNSNKIPDSFSNHLALDKDENIYVSDAIRRKIHKLNNKGEILASFGHPQDSAGNYVDSTFIGYSRISLTVTESGNIFALQNVSTRNKFPVKVFNPTGEVIHKIGNPERYRDIAIDTQGNYYLLLLSAGGSVIQKYNSLGQFLHRTIFNSKPGINQTSIAIAVDTKGNLYCLDNYGGIAGIRKYNAAGIHLKTLKLTTNSSFHNQYRDITVDSYGYIYVTDYLNGVVKKISPTGDSTSEFITNLEGPGAIGVDFNQNIYVTDATHKFLKFSSTGSLLMQVAASPLDGDQISSSSTFSFDDKGHVFMSNFTSVAVFDSEGNFIKNVTGLQLDRNEDPLKFAMNKDGSKILLMKYSYIEEYLTSFANREAFIVGKVFDDVNGDCLPQSGERAIPTLVVMAEPGPFYGVSDNEGNYAIPVDTGTYVVKAIFQTNNSRTVTPTCLDVTNAPIAVEAFGSTITGPNLANRAVYQPHLNVNITSNRRRRCFENVTTVSYVNLGYAAAANATVTVQFPPEVILKSASTPFILDSKGKYVFAVGNLEPNQRGTITITDSVSCGDPSIRGLTVCTKAWITPANTYPIDPIYSRADMTVTASSVESGKARFVVRNQGQGNMTDSLSYRVLQNLELSLTGKYKLVAGDSLVLQFPTDSRVIRVEADQPLGHPTKTVSSANIENRSKNTGIPDIAMMAMPTNEPEIAIECLPIVDSFDPNDKQVVPVGLTAEHFTPTNTPLRYTVRFQNTGTDVAYKVVVVDTLAAEVDMATFQVGAVSHPYILSVSGKEKPVLTFTFNNIMLPDSGTNQTGSNGAIQFSVRPKANLPEKHLIENFADIFFDYNEPIRTNTTQNRIFDMPPFMSEKPLSAQQVEVSPVISSFTPMQSRIGALVSIKGRNFAPQAATNQVYFNGQAAQVISATNTEIKVLVPVGAFTGKIKVVTKEGGTTSLGFFTVYQPPTIASITPIEATPGSEVTISGNHFSPDALQDTVYFNGLQATVQEATTTQLKVKVPAGATSGKVVLKTLGGGAESETLFKVWQQPSISSFSPEKGKTGTILTISGSNFAETPGNNKVTVGGVPVSVEEATTTQLTVKVPATAQTGKVVVQSPGGTVPSSGTFVFVPFPEVSAISPASGSVGTTVTITGRHFNADAQVDTVYFGLLPAQVISASETLLVVKAPKYVVTGSIAVAGAGGKTLANEFTVLDLSLDDAVAVYPNPTTDEVSLNWWKADFTLEALYVYNSIGQLIFSQPIHKAFNDELKLSLAKYGKGIYTFRIQTSAGLILKKVVVH